VSLFLTLEIGDMAEVLLYATWWVDSLSLFWTLISKMSLLSAMKACNMAIILLLPLLLLLGGYLQG
jgi:hypothetical protein